ncbi:DNA modification methylase [Sphingomonas sp. M1-B02]|uniref:DNA modification methylase n=1 Tax=Sphingomonas sp. M1-B02 TaxID=3114300 RepID=UPI002240B43F|nr:DNA methyltransferase [Sphingomonas sp. S6-11]UZK67338.1 DNA methyltransferase [Sphingomonas sp. S6-11]
MKTDNGRTQLGLASQGAVPPRHHNFRLGPVEYVNIELLKSYDRKLRKRSPQALDKLKASVSAFGVVLPILIDKHRVIVGGEGIVEAARAAGHREVPTLSIEHLDAADVRRLRIALNKLGETSEWDKVELAHEFGELLSLDVDLDLTDTGFDTVEIDNLVHAPVTLDEEDADDEPVPIGVPGSAVSRLGDLWDLDVHSVMCASSLEPESLAVLMGAERARMVLTDSPYNVKIDKNVSGLGQNKHREFAQGSGEMSEAEFIDFQTRSTKTLAAFCVEGALLYLYMDWRHIWEITSGIRAAGLSMVNLAVWVKRSGAMGSLYRSQHELVFVAKKGDAAHRNNVQLGKYGRNRTNCWFYPGMNTFSAERAELLAMHPTCKNVSMLSDAIRDASDRGEIVLDGFLGSGSTLIAAERTHRVCRGVELDPLYVDAIIARWEKAAGKRATLRSTGETFLEVASRRASEVEVPRPDVIARPRLRAAA